MARQDGGMALQGIEVDAGRVRERMVVRVHHHQLVDPDGFANQAFVGGFRQCDDAALSCLRIPI